MAKHPGKSGHPQMLSRPAQVSEARSYIFELRNCDRAADTDLLIDEVPLEALRSKQSETSRWRWQTGFHAGEISAELRHPGRGPIRFELVTDPDKSKLTRADFDAMLVDIMQDSFALFSLTTVSTGALPMGRLASHLQLQGWNIFGHAWTLWSVS